MTMLLSGCRTARAIRPPAASALAPLYDAASFVDAFAIGLDGPGPHDLDRLASLALAQPGPGLKAALGLRDAAVSLFGVRTTATIRARLLAENTDHIGFFPVKSRSAREMILGEEDVHLDFRLSLLVQPSGDGEELVATTLVQCHNGFGHLYLAAIMPGHKLVVRSLLRKAATRS